VLSRRQIIKLGVLGAIAPRRIFSFADSWNFAVFSDTHYGIPGHIEKNEPLLREIAAASPAFAIDAGDLTERAWPFEFDQATRAFAGLPYKVHVTPGNHDVRWAPGGPLLFQERVGPTRQLIQHKGCAFLLLDSTVPLSHFGHIGGPQLRWIQQQMATVGPETPLFVFMHHPVGRPSGIDDDARLAEVLAPYNTKVMFTAHGHADLVWDWNGVTATMSKGLYQGSYQVATIDNDAGVLRLARRTTEKPALTTFAEIPLARRQRPAPAKTPASATRAVGNVAEVWRRPLGGGVMSELIVHDGTLYVSCMDGALYAFNQRDGQLRWKAQTGGYLHSTPTIAGRNVIVGSADGSVYAFRGSNGTKQWQVETRGPVYGSAAVAQGVAAIASGDGVIYGLDAVTGRERWRYTLEPGPSAFAQSPAITDGHRFYIGAWDQHVYALDARSGKEAWRYRATERGFYFSAAIARAVIHDDRLIIPSNENTLHAIDTRNGNVVWKANAPGDKFGYSSPALANDRIYIGSLGDKGQVHCLNPATGAFIWTTATGETIYESSPAVAGNHLAIGSVSGLLSVLRTSDGAITGSYRFPAGLFLSTPVAHRNFIYAATFAEEVVALRVT
jgi:outer membrane protein assembly factor BamB